MNEAAEFAPGLVQLAAMGREPSLSRAAARSGTSQPSLSRAVRRWESVLGFPLVVAEGRSLRLTDDARSIAVAADEAIALVDRAIARVRGDVAGTALTVGYLRSLGPTVVGDLVTSFLGARPDVRISQREDSSTGLIDALDGGEVDVAITAPRPPSRLGWMPLGDQALTVMLPTSHTLASRDVIALADLADEPFLALDHRFHTRQLSDALCAAAGFTPRIILEADSLVTVANYVAAGLGVSIVPADATAHPRTANVPIADPGAHRQFGVAWAKDRTVPAVVAFLSHTTALNERYPDWARIEV